jgi:hypothetical protein
MSGNLAGRNVYKLNLIKMDIRLITGKYSFLKEKNPFPPQRYFTGCYFGKYSVSFRELCKTLEDVV